MEILSIRLAVFLKYVSEIILINFHKVLTRERKRCKLKETKDREITQLCADRESWMVES